jgi:hypothetical protein
MTQEQVDRMREEFIGKRISFEDEKGEVYTGVCKFLGYNPYLPSWKLQITIYRTPVSHVKPETIKIVE